MLPDSDRSQVKVYIFFFFPNFFRSKCKLSVKIKCAPGATPGDPIAVSPLVQTDAIQRGDGRTSERLLFLMKLYPPLHQNHKGVLMVVCLRPSMATQFELWSIMSRNASLADWKQTRIYEFIYLFTQICADNFRDLPTYQITVQISISGCKQNSRGQRNGSLLIKYEMFYHMLVMFIFRILYLLIFNHLICHFMLSATATNNIQPDILQCFCLPGDQSYSNSGVFVFLSVEYVVLNVARTQCVFRIPNALQVIQSQMLPCLLSESGALKLDLWPVHLDHSGHPVWPRLVIFCSGEICLHANQA